MNLECKPDLVETLHLLDLIFIRNKNQHRLQKWWKWLGLFRRKVRDIVSLIEAEEERRRDLVRGTGARGLQRDEAKAKDQQKLDWTLEWMHTVGIEGCYQAFTSLVSDTQFSVLGVVLIAILARFAKVIEYRPKPEHQQPIRPTVLSTSQKDAAKEILGLPNPFEDSVDSDLGIVIQRSGSSNLHGAVTATDSTLPVPSQTKYDITPAGDLKSSIKRRDDDMTTSPSGVMAVKKKKKSHGKDPTSSLSTSYSPSAKSPNPVSQESTPKVKILDETSVPAKKPKQISESTALEKTKAPMEKKKKKSTDSGQGKELGAKKVKKRKGNAIDDLFAGLG